MEIKYIYNKILQIYVVTENLNHFFYDVNNPINPKENKILSNIMNPTSITGKGYSDINTNIAKFLKSHLGHINDKQYMLCVVDKSDKWILTMVDCDRNVSEMYDEYCDYITIDKRLDIDDMIIKKCDYYIDDELQDSKIYIVPTPYENKYIVNISYIDNEIYKCNTFIKTKEEIIEDYKFSKNINELFK